MKQLGMGSEAAGSCSVDERPFKLAVDDHEVRPLKWNWHGAVHILSLVWDQDK
jgi:hypothetical protein